MKIFHSLCLAALVLASGCRLRSQEVSNEFELQAQSRADLLATDVARYERDCVDSAPRSDGCLGLAQTLDLMGRELETAGQTDTAISAMRRAMSLWEKMELDEEADSSQAKDYVGICMKLAQTIGVQDPQASSLLETARVKIQSLRQAHPKDSSIAHLAVSVWREVGDLHVRANSNQLALEFHIQSAGLLDSLAKMHPTDSTLNAQRFQAWELAYRDLETIGAMENSADVAHKALAASRVARALDKSDPPNSVLMEQELNALNWITLAHASAKTWNLADKEQREAVELARKLFSADPSDRRRRMLLADAWMRSADFDCRLDRKNQGKAAYMALPVFVDSFPEDPWAYSTKSKAFADLVECVDPPAEQLDYARQAAKWADLESQGSPSQDLENALGTLSWHALVNRQPTLADSAARQGLALADRRGMLESARWMELNLAHALLDQGKTAEAVDIYLTLGPKTSWSDNSKTYAWFIEDDFKQLEKAGFTHPDFAKVRSALKQR
ncbi:MAG: hypothetical protein IPN71_06495 [Fibrobacteres bacterium]|jgi:hypothetical protein|nr:hypothetical protein [Fibrobacterota bacterium]